MADPTPAEKAAAAKAAAKSGTAPDSPAAKHDKNKTVLEGITIAFGNLVRSLDAIISQVAHGGPVTPEQLAALKVSADGIRATLDALETVGPTGLDAPAPATEPVA